MTKNFIYNSLINNILDNAIESGWTASYIHDEKIIIMKKKITNIEESDSGKIFDILFNIKKNKKIYCKNKNDI